MNEIFTSTELAAFLFADNTQCSAENKNFVKLIDLVSIELQVIANWLRSHKMAVNVNKISHIIFHSDGNKVTT
jgi:hypothetical protein